MKTYAYQIDPSNPNQSWMQLISWVGINKKVLDVGCGRGQMGYILNSQFNCTVAGLEINSDYAKECRGYEQVLLGNIEENEFLNSVGGQYDAILCGDVLEHLRAPEVPLRAFHRLLAPQGRLLISVPNVAQIRIRLMHLRGRWDYTPEGIMDRTHLRWFTQDTIRQLVKSCGWHEEEFNFILGPNFFRFVQRFHIPKPWLRPNLLASQLLLNLSTA